ncbi:hypothetical protein FRB98_005967 [Tulasnella sp. 332]|nr:hypothetical protein FRB98_005967 [Tulasnella sp. 332]
MSNAIVFDSKHQQNDSMEDVVDEKATAGPTMEVDEPAAPYSVLDYESFAAKHMPDLGHEIADFKHYSWRPAKWRTLDKKITSSEFVCGGHKWRILLFPTGNSNAPPNEAVSIYLDYADPKGAPEGWHACAQFALVMHNPHDPTDYVVSHAHHRFTAEECDWGFTRFHELRKLYASADGVKRPIIENDETNITVFVRVLVDPTGVLWHNFIHYDSKKETGYVGLKNQGATCYMNSLLQSLFCTSYFRKAVYQIPTQDDVPAESVALALQRVFYNLQTSDQAVGTNELTRSFGWKSLDSFMQHDVQEFNRVLQEKLEGKMKGTLADGAITKLFVGKMRSYVKCVNIDFVSTRSEDFYDIQLNVKGMRNLYDSFKDYISVETLDGDNKYFAEGLGLQDAKKGVIFQSFPDVLHLQLKRFEYDMQKDAMVKINDRHEFPFEINLEQFLDESADRSQTHIYHLHGVLVHSGDLHGGHYFALIKPDKHTRWLKFDDDRVTAVTDKEVLEENYGGEGNVPNGVLPVAQRNQVRASKRMTNAYMLVYIRDSAVDSVLAPFTEKDTPPHLKQRLEDERQQAEAKKREREEQHLYLTAKIITDDSFSKHQGFDLAAFEDKTWPASELATFRVLKQELYSTFKGRVANHFNVPEQQIRLWVLVNRQNKTVRPDIFVPETEATLNVESVRNSMAARQSDLRLYLDIWEIAPNKPIGQPFADVAQNHIMIFLKYFDVQKQTLLGVCKVYMQRTARVGDLSSVICEKMRWAPQTPIKLYEARGILGNLPEIKPGMIELMKAKTTFQQSEIQDGDIICFQSDITEKEALDYEQQGLSPTPVQFYDFLMNRVLINFKPRDEEKDKEEFDLTFHKKMNYETLAQKVGEKLNHEPIKLRFFASNAQGHPKGPLKRALNQSVWDIIQPVYTMAQPSLLFYERLDVSIIELETKRSLKVIWTGVHNKEEATLPFLLPKTNMIHDLADQILKQVTLSAGSTNKIRVFEVTKDGKYQKEFNSSEMLGNLPETEFYAEEIPREELEPASEDKIINVFHYTREPARSHGVPFKFAAKPGEKFTDTKKRIQERIGVSDKDITKYRFALIQIVGFKQPTYLEDDDVVYEHKFAPEDVLGLDHVDKTRVPESKGINIKG